MKKKYILIFSIFLSFILVSFLFIRISSLNNKSVSKNHAHATYINQDISTVTDTGNHSINIDRTSASDNFVTAGSAYLQDPSNGTYSITQAGNNNQLGYVVFKNQIDMTQTWSITFGLNMDTMVDTFDNVNHLGGDFIGLILTPANQTRLQDQTDINITVINPAASNLGIGSLPSTTIFGLDLYNNSNAVGHLITDPTDPSYSGDWFNGGPFLETIAGFRYTYGSENDVNGYAGRLVSSQGAVNGPQQVISSINGQTSNLSDSEITVNYQYNGNNSGTLTATTADGNTYTQTLSYDSSDPSNQTWKPIMSVGASAATGGYTSNMGVNIDSFNLTLATAPVLVHYYINGTNVAVHKDTEINQANTGDTITVNSTSDGTVATYVYTPTYIPGYTFNNANILTVDQNSANNNLTLNYDKDYQEASIQITDPSVLPLTDPLQTNFPVVVSGSHTNDAFFTNDPNNNLFNVSDNSSTTYTLQRSGYSYNVTYHHTGDPNDGVVYQTLAAALNANPKFDATDNSGSIDSDPQVFSVTYTSLGRTTIRSVPNFDFGNVKLNSTDTYFLANSNVAPGSANGNYLNLDLSNDQSTYAGNIADYLATNNTEKPVSRALVVTGASGNKQNTWIVEASLAPFTNGDFTTSKPILNFNTSNATFEQPFDNQNHTSQMSSGTGPLNVINSTLTADGTTQQIINNGTNPDNRAIGTWVWDFSNSQSASLNFPKSIFNNNSSNKTNFYSTITWTLVSSTPDAN